MKDRYSDRRIYFEELAQTSKEYISRYISTYKDIKSCYHVMEIGCGEGGNLVPFAEIGCKVCGIDISTGKIETRESSLERKGSMENLSAQTLSYVISSYMSGDMISLSYTT
jgi:2-polyprenyl-3-methyl-5-hydroxy-6-metoxy-1,4-benzoquinol methylase